MTSRFSPHTKSPLRRSGASGVHRSVDDSASPASPGRVPRLYPSLDSTPPAYIRITPPLAAPLAVIAAVSPPARARSPGFIVSDVEVPAASSSMRIQQPLTEFSPEAIMSNHKRPFRVAPSISPSTSDVPALEMWTESKVPHRAKHHPQHDESAAACNVTPPSFSHREVASRLQLSEDPDAISSMTTASAALDSDISSMWTASQLKGNQQLVLSDLQNVEQRQREIIVEGWLSGMQEIHVEYIWGRSLLVQRKKLQSAKVVDVLQAQSPHGVSASKERRLKSPARQALGATAREALSHVEEVSEVWHAYNESIRAASSAGSARHRGTIRSRSPPLQRSTVAPPTSALESTAPRRSTRSTSPYSLVFASPLGSLPGTLNYGASTPQQYSIVQIEEEERSGRNVFESFCFSVFVNLRQLHWCVLHAWNPRTLFVQERHEFLAIRSLFEAEHAVATDEQLRWRWEQHAQRVHFWARRLANMTQSEAESRERIISEEHGLRRSASEDFTRMLKIMVDDWEDALRAREQATKRMSQSLIALESSSRSLIVATCSEALRRIRDAEGAAFQRVLEFETRSTHIIADESALREELLNQEATQRRHFQRAQHVVIQRESLSQLHVFKSLEVSAEITEEDPDDQPRQNHTFNGHHEASYREPSVIQPLAPSHADVSLRADDTAYSWRPLSPPALHDAVASSSAGGAGENFVSEAPHPLPTLQTVQTASFHAEIPSFMRPTSTSERRSQRSASATSVSFHEDNPSAKPEDQGPFPSSSITSYPASEIRLAASSTAQSVSESAGEALRRKIIPESQLQRTVERLAVPRRRAEEADTDVPPLVLSNLSLTNRSVLSETVKRDRTPSVAASGRRSPAEPFSKVRPVTIPAGNSVMILRGGADAPKPKAKAVTTNPATISRLATPKRAAVTSTGTTATVLRQPVGSRRRYVDAYLALSTSNALSEGGHSQNSHAIDTPVVLPDESPVVVPRRHSEAKPMSNAPHLTRWEASTVQMYESSSRRRRV